MSGRNEYVKSGKHACALLTILLLTVSPALSSNLSNLPSVYSRTLVTLLLAGTFIKSATSHSTTLFNVSVS